MDYPAEFVEQLVGLSRSVRDEDGVALQRIADLAVEQLDGCDMAGVTLVHDDEGTTAVFTDEEAPEIDRAQYDTGHGPCLDAYRTGTILRIDETLDEDRWPAFTEAASDHGVRSTLSLPLRVDERHHRRAQPVLPHAARVRRQRADRNGVRRACRPPPSPTPRHSRRHGRSASSSAPPSNRAR